MTDITRVEYRVRPVTRYIVTRYHEIENGAGSESFGEFDNDRSAYKVAYALCADEHVRLGWPVGDGRVSYPEHPDATKDYNLQQIDRSLIPNPLAQRLA